MKKTVQISLDRLNATALRGARRAAIFMGLGVNAANDDRLSEYDLTHLTQIQLVPSDLPRDRIDHFKDEFATWVVANGLRELIESFAVFLDEIHSVCLHMALQKQEITESEFAKWVKRFPYEGLGKKLEILEHRFDLVVEQHRCLPSINDARNCLTHRLGRVAKQDCSDGMQMLVRWHSFDVYAVEPDGHEYSLSDIPPGGLLLPAGGDVRLRWNIRERSFSQGDVIKLLPRDLAEICFYVQRKSFSAVKGVQEYAAAIGVPIERVQGKVGTGDASSTEPED